MIVLYIFLGFIAVWIGWFILTRGMMLLFCKLDETGRSEQGLVIFVESIRWLGIPWGRHTCLKGLRKAGFDGEFLYWRWHSTWRAWLVLPTIMNTSLLEQQSRRLADYLIEQKRTRPDRPIRLMGYSCGGYVAMRALELLPGDVQVESAAVLAGAISPWRDLRPAGNHVRGALVVSSCLLDAVILGIGTLLVGTADRVHTLSLGMVGYHGPAGENIVQIHWRLGMIHLGNVGGHFAATATDYIAQLVAPMMGILLE